MSVKITKDELNIREQITTLHGKTSSDAIIKALSTASGGVGIGTDQPEGVLTVMSQPLNWSNSYADSPMRALTVGGGDSYTSALIIHANCFKYPAGQNHTTGSSWSGKGAYWATPMIYRSGSAPDDFESGGNFPFNGWGELILQGTSHGSGYNKGISFVTWNPNHVDENGDPDPYSQSAMTLAMRVTDGNVGIGTTNPVAKIDIQRNGEDGRELKIGQDTLTHYDYTSDEYRGKNLEVRLTGNSYHQSEVIVTCHRTNTSSNGGNNLYIRGIWHNNYTNHYFEEIERVGNVDDAVITFQATDASFGTTDNSAGLKINLTSGTASIQGLYIRVTDFRNAHNLSELITS